MNIAGFPKSFADEMKNGMSDAEANSDRRRMVQKKPAIPLQMQKLA
jgi:hypothetical protein